LKVRNWELLAVEAWARRVNWSCHVGRSFRTCRSSRRPALQK